MALTASVAADKANATPQWDDHPGHHNLLAAAANDLLGRVFDARAYGARGDGRQLGGGGMTAGQRRVTCPQAAFTQADVGTRLSIGHAGLTQTGVPGGALTATIIAVVDATRCDLDATASQTVTDEFVMVRDDTAALQAAIDACTAAGGGVVYLPPGRYHCGEWHHDVSGAGTNHSLRLTSGVVLRGASPFASVLVGNDQTNLIQCTAFRDDGTPVAGGTSGVGLQELGAEGCSWATPIPPLPATPLRGAGDQFKFLGVSQVAIRNVVTWHGAYPFQFGGCTDVRVTDCVAIQPQGAEGQVPPFVGRGFSVFNELVSAPGVALPNPLDGAARCLFENCTVIGGTGSGFYVAGGFDVGGTVVHEPYGIKFSNCMAEGDGATLPLYGFYIRQARVGLANCEARKSGLNGFLFSDVVTGAATGCLADTCGLTAPGYPGFGLQGTIGVRLVGCHARGGSGSGFSLATSALGVDCTRNVVSGCIATNNVGVGFQTSASNHNGRTTYDGCNGTGNSGGTISPRLTAADADFVFNCGAYSSQSGLYVDPTGSLVYKSPTGAVSTIASAGVGTPVVVTGSRGGNAALASLLTQLAALGTITDSSSV